MRTLSTVLREQYGEKIYKLSLSSGCTCPNRDGTVGFGGCAFCSEGGSGEFASTAEEIEVQIEEAKERIRKKVSADRL
jgi:radical SAM superfamily enzyme